MVQDCGDIL